MAGLPDLLTIEEAARVIRVGRTKAYAMAREWRATGGRSGLPVVDFGHVLRVPRCQLEMIVGGPLTAEGVGGGARGNTGGRVPLQRAGFNPVRPARSRGLRRHEPRPLELLQPRTATSFPTPHPHSRSAAPPVRELTVAASLTSLRTSKPDLADTCQPFGQALLVVPVTVPAEVPGR